MNLTFPPQLEHGSGVSMTLQPERLMIELNNPADASTASVWLNALGVVVEHNDPAVNPHQGVFHAVNHTARRLWVHARDGHPFTRDRCDELVARSSGRIAWLGPVYRFNSGEGIGSMLCPLPNVVLVKPVAPKDKDRRLQLRQLTTSLGLVEVEKKSRGVDGFLYFTLTDPSPRPVYDLVHDLRQKTDLVALAKLENMPMLSPIAKVPDDPLVAKQWAMERIAAAGPPGARGWDLGTGAGVTIAVLDSGVDLTHPDLSLHGAGIRLDTMGPDGSPQGIPEIITHGTRCAGLAAARYNNAEGMAGVAGSADVLPIAFVNWTDYEVEQGIRWAADQGAQVLLLSFAMYAPGEGLAPTGWDFSIIDPAIEYAVDVKGVVLVAGAGNEDTDLVNGYPARNPRTIAVGGSDEEDVRKNWYSPDGEGWGANYGPGLSVVAPCVHNVTTDVGGGYYDGFNGTSASTPLVAGIACAILGAHPGLTPADVRALIESTADPVGPSREQQTGQAQGGMGNPEAGYGRVNMFAAMQEAGRRYP